MKISSITLQDTLLYADFLTALSKSTAKKTTIAKLLLDAFAQSDLDDTSSLLQNKENAMAPLQELEKHEFVLLDVAGTSTSTDGVEVKVPPVKVYTHSPSRSAYIYHKS